MSEVAKPLITSEKELLVHRVNNDFLIVLLLVFFFLMVMYNSLVNFKGINEAMISLLRSLTGEDWYQIMWDAAVSYISLIGNHETAQI